MSSPSMLAHRPDPGRRRLLGRLVVAVAVAAGLGSPVVALLCVHTGHLWAAEACLIADLCSHAVALAAAARYAARTRAELAAAYRDPVTGLPTRAVGERLLGAATATGTPVVVALADADGLHAINSLGHAAGDQYLQVIAERLARAVPTGGLLVRHGGDEFALLAPHAAAQEVANAIGAAMAGPSVVAGRRVQPRVSVGIADSRGGDAHHARACADAAMYTAKAGGGNQALVYRADRDGTPSIDGTRRQVRRRDLNLAAADGMLWRPEPGDDLLPLLLSAAEARTVQEALRIADPGGTGHWPYGRLADRLTTLLDAASGLDDCPTGSCR